jgi:hypothetical protein
VLHAHADGDSFTYLKIAKVIHAGDLFFKGIYPVMVVNNGGSLSNDADAPIDQRLP